MIGITKGARIECDKCHNQYDISIDEFGEPDINYDDDDDGEREMGTELTYTWQYKAKCKNCDNNISITVEGLEYPEGSLNDIDSDSEGCKIIECPELEA